MDHMQLFNEAKEWRERLSGFRVQRNRYRDYTFGRQWNDLIEFEGRTITEYEFIMREGNVPLKNNLIRRIVRNVIGVFRGKLPDIMKEEYGGELEKTAEENALEELFCRTMEEFLISGMAVHRKRLVPHNGKAGIQTEIVSPSSFFFNTDSHDVRGRDINLVGQTHKVDMRDWCRAFVRTKEDYMRAEKLFDNGNRRVTLMEVWRKEIVPRYLVHDREAGYIRRVEESEIINGKWKGAPKKWIMDEVWTYYFMTDDGTVVSEGNSPYAHGGHPYVMKCYPFLDGEIHSFVADMIDQQRYTNRLVT